MWRMERSELKRNEFIIWDMIMPRTSLKDFEFVKKPFKYTILDATSNLRGKKVEFQLIVEYIPTFGWIH